MALDGENPYLITPPPGLLPEPKQPAAPDDGDSATRRISAPRESIPVAPPVVPNFPLPTAAPVVPLAEEAPPTIPTPAVAPLSTWTFVLPDGTTIPISGAVFLGRNPAATDDAPDAELLSLADDTKSVSKTHALVEVDAKGLWVTDLDSTNGILLSVPGRDNVALEPRERTVLSAGATLRLGEYVIRVERS